MTGLLHTGLIESWTSSKYTTHAEYVQNVSTVILIGIWVYPLWVAWVPREHQSGRDLSIVDWREGCHAPTLGIEAYRVRTDSAPFGIKETFDIKETFLLTRGIEKYVVAGPTYELDLPPTRAAWLDLLDFHYWDRDPLAFSLNLFFIKLFHRFKP